MRAVIALFVSWLATFLAGCGGPLDQKVSAKSPAALASWRANIAGSSSAEHRRRVEDALQEIRMAVAAERERKRLLGQPIAPGAEAVDIALAERVHGRRVGEMLQLVSELRVRRLATELAGLEDAMNKNAQLITRPGDLASRHHLDGLRDRQKARVDKYREELAAAEKELAPLLAASGRRLLGPEEVPLVNAPEEAPQLLKK
ncbi:MAG: hypothetical protein JNL39_21230 [Opitutaceae bacterium]|nr:hypothetical protein [Opitutaceae bacterium]